MNNQATNQPDPLQLLLDDPLSAARLAAQAGARVVGYLGNDVPVALIAASGASPLRLRGIARASTAHADQYLESAVSPELRVIVEQWLVGELDFIDSVVFARTDDSAQRVYYYLCELQRRGVCGGPRPLLYDVANIDRSMSTEYTRESTRRLASELGSDAKKLGEAMHRIAQRERLLSDIRSRRAAAAPVAGSLAWQWERAGACDWRPSFDESARHWLENAAVLSGVCRLLLAGDPLPDDALHRAIEDAGGSVVTELTESVPGETAAKLPTIESLADEFQARRNPVLAMRESGRWIADCARAAGADAAVLWLMEEDESLPWEIARQMRSLDAAGIPTLLLSRRPWTADASSLDSVRGFVSGLRGPR